LVRRLMKIGLAAMTLLLCLSGFVEAAHAGDAPLLIDGESLEFQIRYGSMPAGHARLHVESCEGPGGELYRITSVARSNDFISIFFEVDDRVVTEVDAVTFQTRRFEKDLREGPFEKHVVFTCDPEGVVRSGEKCLYAKPGTRDVLSALYYVRGKDLEVGEELDIETFDNGKIYSARVKVIGEERVSTPAGDFDCLVIEPEVEEGIFSKTGRLVIWVTDDALKMPVLIKSKVSVGSFVAELVSASHLGG
jgi:hypothetical protein